MLILVLVGALLFYMGLYLLWELSQSRLDTAEHWMRAINAMAVMPNNVVFVILRGLILVVALYVMGDFLMATARRSKRKKAERRESERGNRVNWKKNRRSLEALVA